jgi:integrase
MARQPKMSKRRGRDYFSTKRKGVEYNLGTNEKKALKQFYKIWAEDDDTPSPNMKVVDLLERYLQWSLINHAPESHQWYKSLIRSFAKSLTPGIKVKSLKPYHLTAWMDKNYPPQKAKDNTRHSIVGAIKAPFNWAVKQEILIYSPLRNVQKPPKTPAARYLSPEQLDKLMGLVKDQEFRDYLTVAMHTGMRPQEIRIISACHVMFKEKVLRIPKELTKGKRRERRIPLDDTVLSIFQRQALKYPEGPLLRNCDSNPWNRHAINSRFFRLRADLPFRCSAYYLRHSFATQGLANGASDSGMAELLGHADKTMILRVYGHVDKCEDHLRDCLGKATRGIEKVLGCNK